MHNEEKNSLVSTMNVVMEYKREEKGKLLFTILWFDLKFVCPLAA